MKDKAENSNQRGLLIGAVLVAAAGAALWLGRADDARAPVSPDAIAVPSPALGDPALEDGADPHAGALPAGHPPIDGAPNPYADGQPLPPGHPPLDAQDVHEPEPNAPVAGIEKLADGVNVAEIYAKAGELEGKRVRLRAKIVKSMPNILGRTWLHIQDGTGQAAKGDHDLVVTTQGEPTIGATVVVEGLVVRNKDLGSGYRYDVMLEDARVEGGQAGKEG